jgi:glycosyltransferase involved in cell wall biosynthesis
LLFSILIANYNNGRFFKDCYDSIINQTYDNWEAIIVDDHSTDDSVELIKAIVKNDARCKLYENEKNEGCGYTKRKCAELASGEVAGFLDPDDTLMSEALRIMVQEHFAHSEISLIHSNLYFCDGRMKKLSIYDRAKKIDVSDTFINRDAGVTAFSSFKKSFYNKSVGLDASILRAVDQDLYLKMSETGPFYFIDKPLYNYRIHGKGISTSKADHALYWYLKVILKAEERRKVNLENEVAELLNRTDPNNLQINLSNPRYLILAMSRAFKKNPVKFFKKLFINR